MDVHVLDELVEDFVEAYPVALGRPCVIPHGELRRVLFDELQAMETKEARLRALLHAALDEAKRRGRLIEGLGFLHRYRLREGIERRTRVREALRYDPIEPKTEGPQPMEEEELLRNFERHTRIEEGRAERTVLSYSQSLAGYRAFLASRAVRLQEAERDDVLAWKESLFDRGNCARTINVRLAAVKALHRFMVVSRLTERDPTRYVRYLPEQKKRMPILTAGEVDRLLSVIDRQTPGGLRDFFLVVFLFATAGRIGEVTSLRVQDVDLPRGAVTFRGRKNKEDNVVCLTREALEELRRYLRDVRPQIAKKAKDGYEDLVILSLHGRRFDRSNVSRILKRYAKLAKIEKQVTSHTIRRSIATILANNGMPAELLKVLLGHKSLNTTLENYIVYSQEGQRRALEEFHPFAEGRTRPSRKKTRP